MSFVGHLQFGHRIRINHLPNLFFVLAVDDHVALHVVDITDRPTERIPLFVPLAVRRQFPWDCLQQLQFIDTSHMTGWTGYYQIVAGDQLSVSLEVDPATCMTLRVLQVDKDAIVAEIHDRTVYLDFAFRGMHAALGLFAVARLQPTSVVPDEAPVPPVRAPDLVDWVEPSGQHWLARWMCRNSRTSQYERSSYQPPAAPGTPIESRWTPVRGTMQWKVVAETFRNEGARVTQVHVDRHDDLQRWRHAHPLERQFVEHLRTGYMPGWVGGARTTGESAAETPAIDIGPSRFQLPPSLQTRLPKVLAKRFRKAPTPDDVFYDPDLDDLDYRLIDTLPRKDPTVVQRLLQVHVHPWPAHVDLPQLAQILCSHQRPVTDNCYGVLPHKTNPRYYVFTRNQWHLLKVPVDPTFVNVVTARQQNNLTPFFRTLRADETLLKPKADLQQVVRAMPPAPSRKAQEYRVTVRDRWERSTDPLWMSTLPNESAVTLSDEDRVPKRRRIEMPVATVDWLPASPHASQWLQRHAVLDSHGQWADKTSGQYLEICRGDVCATTITPLLPTEARLSRDPARWAIWHRSILDTYDAKHPRRQAWLAPSGVLYWSQFVRVHGDCCWTEVSTETAEQFWWLAIHHHPNGEAFRQWLQTQQVSVAPYALPRAYTKEGWPTPATMWLLRYGATTPDVTRGPLPPAADETDWVAKAIAIRPCPDDVVRPVWEQEWPWYATVASCLAPTWVVWVQWAAVSCDRWTTLQQYLRHHVSVPRWVCDARIPAPPRNWTGDQLQQGWRWVRACQCSGRAPDIPASVRADMTALS